MGKQLKLARNSELTERDWGGNILGGGLKSEVGSLKWEF